MTEMNDAGWIAGPTGEERTDSRHRAFTPFEHVGYERMGSFGLEGAELIFATPQNATVGTGLEQAYGEYAVDGEGHSIAGQPVPYEAIVQE